MSFDFIFVNIYGVFYVSQSLSSRAMSFDEAIKDLKETAKVSIPFEQGNVFRLLNAVLLSLLLQRLNPFRSGRCLSTYVC